MGYLAPATTATPNGSPPPQAADRLVLVVEDDDDVAAAVAHRLRANGYDVDAVPSGWRARDYMERRRPGVILLDIELPDSRDLALFADLKAASPHTRIIFMTANTSLDLVIAATKAGAFDFISKATSGEELMERVVVTVRNAFAALGQDEKVAALSRSVQSRDRFPRIISQSPQMEEVRAAIDKLSGSKVNVLITGPSGTGKEVVAHTIHEAGPRAREPFVAVNCAGIPDTLLESELFGYERGAFTGAVARKIGKFEAAHGGTLFLDEIGEMSLSLQAKLLRVLQDARFERLGGNQLVQADARIICATNRDLQAMVRNGTFREDLYYRIAVFQLQLPGLAERRGDIALLTSHFVRRAAADERKEIEGVEPEVLRLFESYAWPGNVRQLQNVIARSAVVCTTTRIALRDLPDSFVQDLQTAPQAAAAESADFAQPRTADWTPRPGQAPPSLLKLTSGPAAARLEAALALAFPDEHVLPTAEELEAAGIRLAFRRLGGNMQLTARRLGLSRATLYRRLEGLALVDPEAH